MFLIHTHTNMKMIRYITLSNKFHSIESIDLGSKDSNNRDMGLSFQINELKVRPLKSGGDGIELPDFCGSIVYEVTPNKLRNGETFGRLANHFFADLESAKGFILKTIKKNLNA